MADVDPAMVTLAESLAAVLARPAPSEPAAPAAPAAPEAAAAPPPAPEIPDAPLVPAPVAALAAEQAAAGIKPGNEVTRERLKSMSAREIAALPQATVNAAIAEGRRS